MDKRSAAYLAILDLFDHAVAISRRPDVSANSPDVIDLKQKLTSVGNQVTVSCDAIVREVVDSFRDTFIEWLESRDEDLVRQALDSGRIRAAQGEVRASIAGAAVRDRTSEITPDGIGGR